MLGARRIDRIGVLADDFSGAGDVALAFESAGWTTEIGVLRPGMEDRPGPRVRVWIIDTESRSLSPRRAARRVVWAAAVLEGWNPGFVFKKIDSTLRGPVAEELAALMKARGVRGPVTVVPAFPKLGRTVRNGRLFVHGVPLHETPFGRDPRHPRSTDDVVAMAGGPLRATAPDVRNEKDLRAVARRVARGDVAVGSSGFAAEVGRALRGKRAASPSNFHGRGRSPGPAVVGVVVGSAHPISEQQAELLDRWRNRRAGDVSLFVRPRRRGDPGRVLLGLVRRAERWRRGVGVRRWVVTGGETAFALARKWGLDRWRVHRLVETGVPLLVSVGKAPVWMVVKPGGFGTPRVLVKAARWLLSNQGRSRAYG